MPDDENKPKEEEEKGQDDDDISEVYDEEPTQILANSIRDLANDPTVAKSVADFIGRASNLMTAVAECRSAQPKIAIQSLRLSLGFGLLIFIGIGFLGYLKIVSGEATTGLLGTLIGYWYGQRQQSR